MTRMNRLLDEPLENYLSVTPSSSRRSSLSRIPVYQNSPNNSRIRNSLPSRLTYQPDNSTANRLDRSLNTVTGLSPFARSTLNQSDAYNRNLRATENLPFVPSSEFAPQYTG